MVREPEVVTLTAEQAQQMRAGGAGRRNYERVIYYRKPDGWITWNGSQASKQIDFISRGFVPLPKYGFVSHQFPNGQEDPAAGWRQILSHPEGIREFTVGQILALRWHREPPISGLKFPQLAEWIADGHQIIEYGCPECSVPPYADPSWLARHLRNAHDYTQAEVISVGEKLGIDFSRTIRRADGTKVGKEVFEYEVDEGFSPTDESPEPEYDIETVQVDSPRRATRSRA